MAKVILQQEMEISITVYCMKYLSYSMVVTSMALDLCSCFSVIGMTLQPTCRGILEIVAMGMA
jgi:hypothetical protein